MTSLGFSPCFLGGEPDALPPFSLGGDPVASRPRRKPTLAPDQADRCGMTSPNQEEARFRNTYRPLVTFLKDTSKRVERNNPWITQTLRC